MDWPRDSKVQFSSCQSATQMPTHFRHFCLRHRVFPGEFQGHFPSPHDMQQCDKRFTSAAYWQPTVRPDEIWRGLNCRSNSRPLPQDYTFTFGPYQPSGNVLKLFVDESAWEQMRMYKSLRSSDTDFLALSYVLTLVDPGHKARSTRVKQAQLRAQRMEKFPLSCACFKTFTAWTGCLRLQSCHQNTFWSYCGRGLDHLQFFFFGPAYPHFPSQQAALLPVALVRQPILVVIVSTCQNRPIGFQLKTELLLGLLAKWWDFPAQATFTKAIVLLGHSLFQFSSTTKGTPF